MERHDAGPTDDLEGLSDQDLLAGGLGDQLAENVYAWRRLDRLDRFRARLELTYQARRAVEPHFTPTPLQECVLEASDLWGLDASRVQGDLRRVRMLKQHFPDVWTLCVNGQLDTYKGALIADTARQALDRPKQLAALAVRINGWLRRGIPHDPDDLDDVGGPRLVNRTAKQLRNKLNYEMKRLRPKDSEDRFHQAFKDRKVRANLNPEDGMGYLDINHSADQIQLADYRLSLVAKALRAGGDQRTLEQLRADVAIDLILGRLQVTATISELTEADDTGTALPPEANQLLPTSNYARPIINVTVPIQTLMGLSDSPGTLSGGTVIPAALARQIAADPESTWYRMLTDEHGHCQELSTKSYHPTKPIWRDVVAKYGSCYRRNCTRPATTCELDHRTRFPRGKTSTTNLQPGCKSDHRGKHSPGFSITQNADGTLTYTTAAGFTHTTEQLQHPVSTDWPAGDLFEVQHSATEFIEALQRLRDQEAAIASSFADMHDIEKLWACYRASYPDATDEQIHYWINGTPGEDEVDHVAPPLLKNGYTGWELAARARARRGEDLMLAG